ncbi:TrkA-N domain protein [Desulfonatronospira thiodismutans ASO3-1]|uniref:TrkA-N domain protein n=1 Tax=Desulfonatronospira thiodismutans ASO3-1 TaxID=555779 RepID=D6SUV0_9BACT|nr:NAD-binding protein [Desulfonatronospira thiodismutans]EFI33080.1 TrkA-N domain protein [Desulfonatronospira thiodismutans ASO3-1]
MEDKKINLNKKIGQFVDLRHACFALILFILFYILALLGLMRNDIVFLDAAYKALQMIVMNADLHEARLDMNIPLQISRFALPLFAAFSIIAVLFKIAGQQICYFRHSISPRKNVFLGAGRMAFGIIQSLDEDTPIIAMDINIDKKYAISIRERPNSILLHGDARDINTLKRLKLNKVDTIYIFTGDDNLDLDITSKVISLIPEKQRERPRLIVDIEDKSLRRIAGHIPNFQEYREKDGGIIWFSAKSLAARKLLIEYPPITISSQKYKKKVHKKVHIGIVGLGDFAKETVLQLVRHCVFFEDAPLLISLFDNDESQFQKFIARHPVLNFDQADAAYGGRSPIADILFYHYDTNSTSPGIIRRALSEREDIPFSRIYVTGDNDYSCVDASYRISQCLQVLRQNADVVCCLPELNNNTILIKYHSWETYTKIHFYQIMKDMLGRQEKYPGEISDNIGMMIHAAYGVINNKKDSEISEIELSKKYKELKNEEWIKLTDFQQYSSRHSGDHIFVKLREIGFSLEPCSNASTLPSSEVKIIELEKAIDENMENLKKNEHKRFCMERLIDDWLFDEKKDKPMQINNTIVKYEKLDEAEHDKDVAIIKALPHIVKMYIETNQFKLVRQQ